MVKAKNKKNSRAKKHHLSAIQKIILSIIIVMMFIVIIAIICSFLFKTENVIKSKINIIATDYYENYFYEKLSNSENFQKLENLDKAMEKYHNNGFSTITLRQLLLYDNRKNSAFDFLKDHCDENKTFVKFYPDPPYSKTSYHAEYTYTCNF